MTDSILQQRDGALAIVTLNRPDRRNALDKAMWKHLGEVIAGLNADPSLRCIVLRGGGGQAFAAGADISEFETARGNSAQAADYAEAMHPAFEGVLHSPHPTLAFVEGACTGGGLELALFCDLRLCNESARFGIPINRLGHVLPYEGMLPLVQLVGRAVALEILLEGRLFSASEAYEKGLVNRVFRDEEAEREMLMTAHRIAEGAPLAARWHKQFSLRALDPTPLSEQERRAPFLACDTDDYREGIRAFLAKETPQFRGK